MENGIKMAPSKARILNMDIPILIEHYSIIKLGKSNLPSTQRKRVQNRIEYLLNKNKITQEEINISMNKLNQIKSN